MKIIMLKTTPGSPNGTEVIKYEKGREYEVPEALARVFVEQIGCAECYDLPKAKSAGEAPENKMAQVPEDKNEEPPEKEEDLESEEDLEPEKEEEEDLESEDKDEPDKEEEDKKPAKDKKKKGMQRKKKE